MMWRRYLVKMVLAMTFCSSAMAGYPAGQGNGQLEAVLDWKSGILDVTGHATAPERGVASQREMVALAAARAQAQKNMADVVNGVRVRARTTLETVAAARQDVLLAVGGVIMASQPVVEEVKWQSVPRGDGGSASEPLAKVTLRLCFDRVSAMCASAPVTLYEGINLAQVLPMPRRTFGVVDAGRYPVAEPANRYTGLVVDLGGSDFLPVLSPEIVTPDGKMVFGGRRVDSRILGLQGPAHYVTSLQDARISGMAGENPFLVRAKGVTGDNQVVIDPQDAAMLVMSSRGGDDFLRLGKVVFVLP